MGGVGSKDGENMLVIKESEDVQQLLAGSYVRTVITGWKAVGGKIEAIKLR